MNALLTTTEASRARAQRRKSGGHLPHRCDGEVDVIPLQHTADVVFLLEEMGLSSKEIAEFWGGKYRDKISVLHIVKSVTTPTFQFPVRVGRAEGTGELIVSDQQPADYAVPKVKG